MKSIRDEFKKIRGLLVQLETSKARAPEMTAGVLEELCMLLEVEVEVEAEARLLFPALQGLQSGPALVARCKCPIGYDSIETLVEFEKEKEHSKEEMSSTSTLLAMIGYWCAILGDNKLYPELVEFIETKLPHCTVQIWFPRRGIKDHLYKDYAANEFGIAEAPIRLPKTIEELRERMLKFIEFSKASDAFETVWNDAPPALPLIASRHFRTPVIPFFWLNHLAQEAQR